MDSVEGISRVPPSSEGRVGLFFFFFSWPRISPAVQRLPRSSVGDRQAAAIAN